MSGGLAPDLQFVGPPLSEGPLPAIFYLALSGHDSLHLDPFNQPVASWKKSPVRIFSLDLPAHGPGEDKLDAMNVWSEGLKRNPDDYFESFFFRFSHALQELSGVITPDGLSVAGLSRGGFIATHLAARFPQIRAMLGFAPATRLTELSGFPPEATKYDLIHIIPRLSKVKLKYYIGNNDTRVGTVSAFEFCHQLAEYKFRNGERIPQAEFSMYPSIGHKGHGTPPEIFRDGANWLLSHLPPQL